VLLLLQVQPDLQQAVEFDNEEATENLRNQLAAYCEVRVLEGCTDGRIFEPSVVQQEAALTPCSVALPRHAPYFCQG
jgi:hypothetical protein